MAVAVADRVKETSATTGVGAYVLLGAVAGFQSFGVIGNGNQTYYCAFDATNWEVGLGTYTASGTTLSRDSILSSSNGGAAVSWAGAGPRTLIVTSPAARGLATSAAPTAGSIPFVGANGLAGQDNANLFWDAANHRLGLGTAAPLGRLDAAITDGLVTHTDATGGTATSAYVFKTTLTDQTFTDPGYIFSVEGTFNPASAPGAKSFHGFISTARVPGGSVDLSSALLRAVTAYSRHDGTATLGYCRAVETYAMNAGVGTVTALEGGVFNTFNLSTGTVGQAIGLHVPTPYNAGGGTITVTKGLLIDSQVAGTQTNTPYAIYQDGATDINYFKGLIGRSTGGADPFSVPNAIGTITVKNGSASIVTDSSHYGYNELSVWVDQYGTANTTAVFGQVRAMGAGSLAWGANFSALAQHAQATLAYGIEVDYGTNFPGVVASGITIWSIGAYPASQGMLFGSYSWAPVPPACIEFYYNPQGIGFPPDRNIAPASAALMRVVGVGAQAGVPAGIDFSTTYFTTAAFLAGDGSIGINTATPTSGLHCVAGGMRLQALATPGAPTAAPQGTTGATTYTYWVVAEDRHGNRTLNSPSGATTTGNATLSSANWVKVTWSAVAGANKYQILKKSTAPTLGGTETILLGTMANDRVMQVTVNYVGAGMSSAPTIIMSNNGGTGSGATVVANMSGTAPNQTVRDVVVTAPGSAYHSGPMVVFQVGSVKGAKATATVVSNAVSSVAMYYYGEAYTAIPTVGFTGGGGSGATATAKMGLSTAAVSAGGTGYTVGDVLTVVGGTRTVPALVHVTTVSAGVVTAITVTSPEGYYWAEGLYTVLPSNPAATTGGTGTGCTLTLTWKPVAVTVTAGGSGYTSTPLVTFATGGVTFPIATASHVALELDDIGQALTSFVNANRNNTADATIDGNLIANAMSCEVVGCAFTQTASISSTTTAETKSLIATASGVGTLTMPGNFLAPGRSLRLKARGVLTTGGTAGTITFQVKLGATVIASTGAVAPTISQANRYWEAEVLIACRTVGTSGTVMAQGRVLLMNAATPVAPICWPIRGNSADPPATVAVDTTASLAVDYQSITSNALHTVTLNEAELEVLN